VAAAPQIGRATGVERPVTAGAAAATDLYERYSAQILSYCLHQLGSREEAEDAVQTTFMNAFRGLQRGIVPELESAWLFKIAHNVCLSRRRSSWRRGRVEAPNNFEVLQEVVPGRDQVADELIRLPDVLEDMPENQRRAILLREWQGLTYREISTELGLSQAAVETLIFRARRALAQGLEQDADTWKRRLRRGADVGGILACVKALLGGGGAAAVKVAATAIAVASTAVAAATEVPLHTHHVSGGKAKPAAHLVKKTTTRALVASAPLAQRSTPRLSVHRTALTRTLPKPAAAHDSQAESATPVPAPAATEAPATAPTTPPPAPPAPPAQQPTPAPTVAAAPPAPAAPTNQGQGKGNDKGPGWKDDRATQATTQPTVTTPTPPTPAPPDPPAQTWDKPTKPDKPDPPSITKPDKPEISKPDKPDKPDFGNTSKDK
jgi:RNA polymerase sigma factor (sigma-70 family)